MKNKLNRYDFIKPMIKVSYSVTAVTGDKLANTLVNILGDSYA